MPMDGDKLDKQWDILQKKDTVYVQIWKGLRTVLTKI